MPGPYISPLAAYYSQFGGGSPASVGFSVKEAGGSGIGIKDIYKGAYFGPAGLLGAGGNSGGGTVTGNFQAWAPGMQASERFFSGAQASGRTGRTLAGLATYGILDQARAQNEDLFRIQEQNLTAAGQARVAGLDRALQETDRFAQAGYARAREAQAQAEGASDVALLGSGMFSSSERFNALRAVQSDSARRFLEVDSAYAGVRSNLQALIGQASAQGLETLANFYERVRAVNEESLMYEFDARLGRGVPMRPNQPNDNGWAAALGQGLGALLGFAIGGPAAAPPAAAAGGAVGAAF